MKGISFKRRLCLLMSVIIIGASVMFTGCDNKTTLAKAYKNYFPIGVALGASHVEYDLYASVLENFNSFTAENEMKWAYLHPRRADYLFTQADQMVAYAEAHNMKIRGHALLWHSSAPDYLFTKTSGMAVTREELFTDIRNHVDTVVKHFGDKVYAWDVVNEVISDGSEQYRQSKFYTTSGGENGGEEYIKVAFEAAEKANPNIKLFYNDYEMINPVKREKTINMIKWLQAEGVKIDGIGMQAHYNIHNFNFEEFEKAIIEFSELNIEVQITELDFSVYQNDSSPAYDYLSPELEQLQARCYQKAFEIMRKHKDKITGVTFWGVADDYSWLDDFPVNGRKNYPLLFDAALLPKAAYNAILDFKK